MKRVCGLDKHYIPTRYPNGFERGAPADFYTAAEARSDRWRPLPDRGITVRVPASAPTPLIELRRGLAGALRA